MLADGENEREKQRNGGDEKESENGACDLIGEADKEAREGGFRGHCGEGVRGLGFHPAVTNPLVRAIRPADKIGDGVAVIYGQQFGLPFDLLAFEGAIAKK